MNFISPFYSPPVVLTTVVNDGSSNTEVISPLKDPMNSWLEVHLKYSPAIKFSRLVKSCETTSQAPSFKITCAAFFLDPSCSFSRSFNLIVVFQLPFYACNSDLNV